ncbi:MAG: glycoside hydrolase family 55 protein, partial [Chloroflexota bacterium]|nr:glycoside hydrolase family 55 protein [Chloroflexota bacterium]
GGAGGAKDLAGNGLTADKSWSFTTAALPPPADTTPPDTAIDSGPSDTMSSASADFTFSSTEPGSAFECSLDGAAYSACTSPKSYTNLSNNSHTFDVRAKDGAGNVDATPASTTFSVDVPPVPPTPPPPDTTPPDTTIDSGPSGTIPSGDVSFTFSSSEAGSTFQCQLGPLESAPASCTSPKAFSGLMAGTEYTFSVWATDASGNTDATPATSTFTPLGTVTNVRDFGATPDDSTNDSAAFERAMAAAVGNPGGGVAYVPGGTYRIANVKPPDHSTLLVEATATLKSYGATGPLFSWQAPSVSTFAQDVHVEGVNGDFTMDLSDAGQDVAGFRIRNVQGFSVKHMLCIQNDSNQLQEAPSSRKPCISFLPQQSTQLSSGLYSAPYDGVLTDLHSTHSPYGWGLIQMSGGQRITISDISGVGGIPLRLENYAANWTPIKDITADGVRCTNGNTAVNFNPHDATHQGNIHLTNLTADSCESGVSIKGTGTYGPDVTVDTLNVIPGNSAQLHDPADTTFVGAWIIGPSQWCVDSRDNLGYTIGLSNLACGGLRSRP